MDEGLRRPLKPEIVTFLVLSAFPAMNRDFLINVALLSVACLGLVNPRPARSQNAFVYADMIRANAEMLRGALERQDWPAICLYSRTGMVLAVETDRKFGPLAGTAGVLEAGARVQAVCEQKGY